MSKRQLSDEAKQTSLAPLPTDTRLKKIDSITSFWKRISKIEESEKDELIPLELVNMLNKFSKNVIKFDIFEECGIYIKDKKYFDDVLLNFNERKKNSYFTGKSLICTDGILEPVNLNIKFVKSDTMNSFAIYIRDEDKDLFALALYADCNVTCRHYGYGSYGLEDGGSYDCKWDLTIHHGEGSYQMVDVDEFIIVGNNPTVEMNILNQKIVWKLNNKLLFTHKIGKDFFGIKKNLLLQIAGHEKVMFNIQ